MEAAFFGGMCGNPSRGGPIFGDGITMRVDTLEEGGSLVAGRAYTDCPRP